MWKSIPSDLEAGFAQIWQPSRCGSDCLASNAYSNHIFIPYCIQTIFNPHFASKPYSAHIAQTQNYSFCRWWEATVLQSNAKKIFSHFKSNFDEFCTQTLRWFKTWTCQLWILSEKHGVWSRWVGALLLLLHMFSQLHWFGLRPS